MRWNFMSCVETNVNNEKDNDTCFISAISSSFYVWFFKGNLKSFAATVNKNMIRWDHYEIAFTFLLMQNRKMWHQFLRKGLSTYFMWDIVVIRYDFSCNLYFCFFFISMKLRGVITYKVKETHLLVLEVEESKTVMQKDHLDSTFYLRKTRNCFYSKEQIT